MRKTRIAKEDIVVYEGEEEGVIYIGLMGTDESPGVVCIAVIKHTEPLGSVFPELTVWLSNRTFNDVQIRTRS